MRIKEKRGNDRASEGSGTSGPIGRAEESSSEQPRSTLLACRFEKTRGKKSEKLKRREEKSARSRALDRSSYAMQGEFLHGWQEGKVFGLGHPLRTGKDEERDSVLAARGTLEIKKNELQITKLLTHSPKVLRPGEANFSLHQARTSWEILKLIRKKKRGYDALQRARKSRRGG